jgi:hypothetical protein
MCKSLWRSVSEGSSDKYICQRKFGRYFVSYLATQSAVHEVCMSTKGLGVLGGTSSEGQQAVQDSPGLNPRTKGHFQ